MAFRRFCQNAAIAAALIAAPLSVGWRGTAAAQPASPSRPPSTAEAAALRAAAAAAGIEEFYARMGWRQVWSLSAKASLESALAERRRHGLDRIAFLADVDAGLSAAEVDVALTQAALAYAGALAAGAVDPAALYDIYTLPRPTVDVAAGLAGALANGRLSQWLEALAPQDGEYRELSRAYLHFSQEETGTSEDKIALAGLIRIGDTDPRVPAIVEQLRDAGYLIAPQVEEPQPQLYTKAASDAVRRLQRSYGLARDGIVGPDTLEVLNLGPGDRARALAVDLERRRWLDRSPASTRIDVNVAAAELQYFRDGRLADARKVIVGSADKQTPALMSPIYRLAANPTWTVPRSIQNGELADVSQAYLDQRNMVLRDGWIVQQPGPNNALGLVKFDMLNPYAIYLHDTSAPALFIRTERQLSHGCVRVEDAVGFARRLAQDQGILTEWEAALRSGDHTFVDLPRRVPVRLLYHNVFVDSAGRVVYRMDPYGRNKAVAEALGFTQTAGRSVSSSGADIGP